MSTLSEAIRSAGLSGDAASVLAALEEVVTIRTDTMTYSMAGCADRLLMLGVSPAVLVDLRRHVRELPIGGDTLEGFLLTAGGEAGGVNFSLDAIRYQLSLNLALEGVITAEQAAVLAGMLQIGVQTGPLWSKLGLAELPVLADVETALADNAAAAIETQRTISLVWLNELVGSVLRPMIETGATIADLKAAVAAQPE